MSECLVIIPTYNEIENVSLLLHMNGSNGSTTFTDSSNAARTVTAYGNAQISTAQSKFGGASGLFDGSGDYIATPSNTAFAFGTGDFTVETFIRFTAFSSVNVFYDSRIGGSSGNGVALYSSSSGTVSAYSGITAYITCSALSTNTWYHIEVSRSSGVMKMFINGTQAGSSATFTSNLSDGNCVIGKTNEASSNYFNGNLDEFRITKGLARHTSAFTTPTAAFPDS